MQTFHLVDRNYSICDYKKMLMAKVAKINNELASDRDEPKEKNIIEFLRANLPSFLFVVSDRNHQFVTWLNIAQSYYYNYSC